ncbi:ATP-binding cassette domain-containing protein [Enterococcus alishanensis]|uniref:ABC transporter ATP-binding protein n=1 Tax=Enterococcus alishanensis TaxID=1303817 RepID=A0ABS6TGZ9_9ENTE|nr:ABC transporter ATP-binding protein [Enterococcus alishanensis]MBV7392170.1 ABC transporter ATP-binding protein [Enterococcus alishanensis]
MLKMENVVVKYPQFELNCSLEVANGQITGIVGENGAGKTTAFKAILGLTEISSGKILIDGQEKTKESASMNIGTVLAESFFNELYTVKDIRMILKNFYPTFDATYFTKLCDNFGLPFKQKYKDFSSGMKAKLKTISALSHGAQLLILDEPTSGLDVSARNEILALLQDYLDQYPESAILISSHISSDLQQVCDDIYYLKNGKVLLHEETDILLDRYGILKVTTEEYPQLAPELLLYQKQQGYGFDVLTSQRNYFLENFPQMVVEKPTIDEILLLMMEGEKI